MVKDDTGGYFAEGSIEIPVGNFRLAEATLTVTGSAKACVFVR
jgi:hypothetical protein